MLNTLFPTALFALSMTATPGPNNMLLTASGTTFGFRGTMQTIAGMVLGIQTQLLLSAAGLGVLFTGVPVLQTILRIVGVTYLLYLAYRIAFGSRGVDDDRRPAKPISWVEGALFQYLNPKAWITSLTAMSVYTAEGDRYIGSAAMVCGVFLLIMPMSVSLWAMFGSALGRFLNAGPLARPLRWTLALMTAASGAFVVL